ncbi:MAG: hypothetical protein ACRDS9_04415 [Pseudonocardiaceae bacterium]
MSAANAFIQNLRRGNYELGVDVDPSHRLAAAFTALTNAIWLRRQRLRPNPLPATQQRA